VLLQLREAQQLLHGWVIEVTQGPAGVTPAALHQLHECQLLAELVQVGAVVICCCCCSGCVDSGVCCKAALQAVVAGWVSIVRRRDPAVLVHQMVAHGAASWAIAHGLQGGQHVRRQLRQRCTQRRAGSQAQGVLQGAHAHPHACSTHPTAHAIHAPTQPAVGVHHCWVAAHVLQSRPTHGVEAARHAACSCNRLLLLLLLVAEACCGCLQCHKLLLLLDGRVNG
jgi:hypothetical protein